MLVHCVIKATPSATGVQRCVVGRCDQSQAFLSSVQLESGALPPEPKIEFSVPLYSLETRPDCYHVYKEWCDDVEHDLHTVCTRCGSLAPAFLFCLCTDTQTKCCQERFAMHLFQVTMLLCWNVDGRQKRGAGSWAWGWQRLAES